METRLNIERGFTFYFKDPKWLEKTAIGAVLTLSIIGVPCVFGWVLEIQQREMKAASTNTLPEWDRLGDYFIEGLKMLLVSFVWFMPFIFFQLLFAVPILLLPLFPAVMEDTPNVFLIFVSFFPFLFMPVSVLFSFITYTIYPIITGLYLENRKIEEAFNFQQVVKLIKANFWILLAASFLGYIASYAASMVGMLLCFIGIFFVSPIATAVLYHFFGQAYRISKIKLGDFTIDETKQEAEEDDTPDETTG